MSEEFYVGGSNKNSKNNFNNNFNNLNNSNNFNNFFNQSSSSHNQDYVVTLGSIFIGVAICSMIFTFFKIKDRKISNFDGEFNLHKQESILEVGNKVNEIVDMNTADSFVRCYFDVAKYDLANDYIKKRSMRIYDNFVYLSTLIISTRDGYNEENEIGYVKMDFKKLKELIMASDDYEIYDDVNVPEMENEYENGVYLMDGDVCHYVTSDSKDYDKIVSFLEEASYVVKQKYKVNNDLTEDANVSSDSLSDSNINKNINISDVDNVNNYKSNKEEL